MPLNETKHERFIRLAENRVNNALKTLELIGNLSNTNNYEYTKQDAQKIVNVLKKSVELIEKKFDSSNKMKFKL